MPADVALDSELLGDLLYQRLDSRGVIVAQKANDGGRWFSPLGSKYSQLARVLVSVH